MLFKKSWFIGNSPWFVSQHGFSYRATPFVIVLRVRTPMEATAMATSEANSILTCFFLRKDTIFFDKLNKKLCFFWQKAQKYCLRKVFPLLNLKKASHMDCLTDRGISYIRMKCQCFWLSSAQNNHGRHRMRLPWNHNPQAQKAHRCNYWYKTTQKPI